LAGGRAPGDQPAVTEESQSYGLLVYTTGLILAVILTATSFWVANTSLLWGYGVHLGLAVLAIAQMGVHLVFILHTGTGRKSTNNVLAVAIRPAHCIPCRRRIAMDHGRSERQHDAAGRDHENANAIVIRRKVIHNRHTAILSTALALGGCARVPSINILGAYFPAWLLCIAAGITLALMLRGALAAMKLDEHVGPRGVVYPAAFLLFTFGTWVLFFRN
jgi:heme/copper-type cytochrome/quinol oxidase subunit 4